MVGRKLIVRPGIAKTVSQKNCPPPEGRKQFISYGYLLLNIRPRSV